jgi:MYXO-CTERM domain-containing protein
VVTGRVEPFPGAVSIVGDHATLTLVDGGVGDADGVVNGVIVDPSGPVVLTSASGASTTSPAAGGGAIGPFGIAVGLLAGWRRRRRKQAGPPPAGS